MQARDAQIGEKFCYNGKIMTRQMLDGQLTILANNIGFECIIAVDENSRIYLINCYKSVESVNTEIEELQAENEKLLREIAKLKDNLRDLQYNSRQFS